MGLALGMLALFTGLVLTVMGIGQIIIAASKKLPLKKGARLLLYGALSLLCSFALCSNP
jgi:uncharacterized membrane protein HdeD (DUF308 family)